MHAMWSTGNGIVYCFLTSPYQKGIRNKTCQKWFAEDNAVRIPKNLHVPVDEVPLSVRPEYKDRATDIIRNLNENIVESLRALSSVNGSYYACDICGRSCLWPHQNLAKISDHGKISRHNVYRFLKFSVQRNSSQTTPITHSLFERTEKILTDR